MTRHSPSAILSILVLCLDLVAAIQFNVRGYPGRSSVRGGDGGPLQLLKRASISGANSSDQLSNNNDISYYTRLNLGGKNFSLLIDTGSSDLWVGGSVPNSKSTGKSASVQYALGGASGPIHTARLDFLGYGIDNQAFIIANGAAEGSGIIGLGPNSGSRVRASLNSDAGNSVLDRIFLQNTTTPNYLTVLLGRSDDPTDQFPGQITVGELVQGYENITSHPKLQVTEVSVRTQGDQHWQIVLDANNGVIGPDGQAISATSVVGGSKNLTAVLDSGFSLPQVPRAISDAIYSRFPGSSFQNVSGGIGEVWTIPCETEVNISFNIGGVTYPIHPLDSSLEWSFNGVKTCVGSFQPKIVQSDTYDIILGMGFLRNAYMLVNFGDFVQGKAGKTADPYVQLLPLTTDLAEAHADFVSVRLNGIDTTDTQNLLSNVTASGPPDPASSSGSTSSSTSSGFVGFVQKHKWIFIGVAIAIGVLLVGLVAVLCCCGSRRRKWMKGVPVGGKGAYRSLHEPAPLGNEHYEYRPPGGK